MKLYSPLYTALLTLTVSGAALATEEVIGPEADSSEPVHIALADGSQPPITSEFFNKLTLQGGYGPENSEVGSGRESFYSLRYEPSFVWYSPEKRWAKWQVYGRVWLDYDSSQAASLVQNENNQNNTSRRERPEGFYAEFRELYVKRNLLWDDPRFSVSAGRQRFSGDYGIWWDDSIESVRFNYTDTFSHGFFAVAQKFNNYNTDVNTLDDNEKNTLYAMGEYAQRWSENNWVGARLMYEQDKSNHDVDDRYDFTGVRSGLFFKGERLTFTPMLSDYHLEVMSLNGKMDRTTLTNARDPASKITDHSNSNGWAVLGEIGKRFDDLAWTPRVALRGGLTDKTKNDADGFRLNAIQSDGITQAGSYSTRLVSSFVSLDLRNLQYYGVALETRPTPRSNLDFRVTDLTLREQDGPLPIRIDADQRSARNAQINSGGGSNGGRSVGQLYDVNYYWKMFPLAYEGKRFDVNGLITASYLKAGNALTSGDDYQISFGVVMSY